MHTRKETEARVSVFVPCPRCLSWNTLQIDKEKQLWRCMHMNCQEVFSLKNHHALLFKDGKCYRVDKDSPKELRVIVSKVLKDA